MSNFLIPAAYAQTAGGGGVGSSLVSFLPIVAVFGIMYFLMIRPQQQKQKQLQNELKALRRGDRIVTSGGIIGIVQKARDDSQEIEVEIAPNVRVMVLRNTVSTVLTSTAKPANDTAQAK
ncbi:preprotein translocase subunit YajC [Acetobacter farinalis]|uniref:Sec translocon accessory complex subunit YajC n=1 Tax=Acetobacter farinalis TaxID=1260984 RepID=A0ABT3Q6K8_9PROT|nr:preprotein translocase subunit YajC [Acetobacter farinalis]MCX2560928.1 preprotein translocase subunit YajC [Acetobacter farinalis]NHO29577.1 preprotein translocase subunit YajC [Acetobacter farinalis]